MEETSSIVLNAPVEPLNAGLVIKSLVLTDLVDSTELYERIGDARASQVSAHHDRLVRDLVAELGGREIDKTDGFLMLFERPVEGVRFALAYHRALEELSAAEDVGLKARAAVHLGEVALRGNRADDIARGAKPLEVEGSAKALVARLVDLAQGGQTLLTRSAFDLARRGTIGTELLDPSLSWLSHGPYLVKGFDDPQEVFEVGIEGVAPLTAPPDSEKARRAVRAGDEITLGWRAAQGQTVPRRPGWRLSEKLSEGGFGDVWLAVQEETGDKRVFKFCYDAERLRGLRREVVLFRLLREGLGHRDDIGRILEWNFDEAPYSLELDYSAGGNLVDWAAERDGIAEVALSVRLELVAQTAEALAAAHSVGILHKDVKPANLLIAGDRTGPRVILTDFGIGMVTDRSLLAASGIVGPGMTTMTAVESSTGGTQIYMAPELLEGRPATIQSDLYALGVILYQMVVGDLSRVLAPGWDREIDDALLCEDIAWIVDGSPVRRPRSGTEVAERLRKLDERRDERRAARRARQEAERSRRIRRALAAVAGVATVFLVVVSLLALRAVEARREAQQLRHQAETLIDFMLFDLRDGLQSIGRLDLLAKVAKEAQKYFASLPDEKDVIPGRRRAVALTNIGDVWMDQGETEAAVVAYREARAIYAARAGDTSDRESTVDLARARLKLGRALKARGQIDDALALFADARAELEKATEAGGDGELSIVLARTLFEMGLTLWFHRASGFQPALEGARDLAEEILENAPPTGLRWQALEVTIDSRQILGHVAHHLGNTDEALTSYRAALERAEQLSEAAPPNLIWRSKVASLWTSVGNATMLVEPTSAHDAFTKALELYEELADADPTNLRWRDGLVRNLCLRGPLEEPATALESFRAALEISRDLEERDPQKAQWQYLTANALRQRGRTLSNLGRFSEALQSLLESREIFARRAELDPDDQSNVTELSSTRLHIGMAYEALGQHESAVEEWERAAADLASSIPSESSPYVLKTYAELLLRLSRSEDAQPVIEQLRSNDLLDEDLRLLMDMGG